jgi:hypothetical protein
MLALAEPGDAVGLQSQLWNWYSSAAVDVCDDFSAPSNIEHELQAKVAQPLRMQGV